MALKKAPASATSNKHDVVITQVDWVVVLEPVLCKDAAAVECLARLLFVIKEAIESGPKGVEQASRALLAGIESAYLYTDVHKAALHLYLLSLTGQLKPQAEPLQLINEAIKQSAIEGELTNKKSLSQKKRRSSV